MRQKALCCCPCVVKGVLLDNHLPGSIRVYECFGETWDHGMHVHVLILLFKNVFGVT